MIEDFSEPIDDFSEPIDEPIEDKTPIETPIKPKRVRTDAQKEALAKARLKAYELRKLKSEAKKAKEPKPKQEQPMEQSTEQPMEQPMEQPKEEVKQEPMQQPITYKEPKKYFKLQNNIMMYDED